MNAIQQAIFFLVNLSVNIYLYLLIIRIFMQKLRAPAWNPVCRTILKITDPVVKPARKYLPGFKGIDFAIVIPVIIIQVLGVFLFHLIQGQGLPHFIGALVLSLVLLLKLMLNIYFFSILISAIATWLAPNSRHPVLEIVNIISTPLLKLVHRWISPFQGIDFSPLIIIICLKLVDILMIYPLMNYAYMLL